MQPCMIKSKKIFERFQVVMSDKMNSNVSYISCSRVWWSKMQIYEENFHATESLIKLMQFLDDFQAAESDKINAIIW